MAGRQSSYYMNRRGKRCMKKICVVALIAIILVPHESVAVDLGEIGKAVETLGVENVLDAAGIDLSRLTDYLDWETINISLAADMANTTKMLGKTVNVDGK